ncbi:MAG TPA: adenylate/guanylate cyclase domain-containing protein [Actinomycetota bacterium]|nr:adenylate/guanylate cyclase domain-containing protein [Actinomycetota bacterium]
MDQPETRYARTPEGAVAYQVIGEGAIDLVFIPDWMTNIAVWWEQPLIERFLRKLASFSRLIVFDKRGTGVSDPVPLGALPTLEHWMDDIRVVMDAAGSERAAIFGHGTPMALVFAASYPERTRALAIAEGWARSVQTEGYPGGTPPELIDQAVSFITEGWEREDYQGMAFASPNLPNDPPFLKWLARYRVLAMPPTTSGRVFRWGFDLDVRSVLPTISVPTLVLQRKSNPFFAAGHSRYLAERIPGAKYVELPGEDYVWFAGDQDSLLDEVQAFFTGVRGTADVDRVLSTVLFTDLVSSTERDAELGDRRWREILDRHDAIVRAHVEHFRGRLIKTTGDGVLATFDGPARAIRCAQAISDEVHALGLEIRSGLHTGEVELRGEDIGGIAVAIAARVMAKAGASEVLVSSTVKDLVVGSGLEFDDRGPHELKGVPGEWRLYAVRS